MTRRQVAEAIDTARRLHAWQAAGCQPSLEFARGQELTIATRCLATLSAAVAMEEPAKRQALALDFVRRMDVEAVLL